MNVQLFTYLTKLMPSLLHACELLIFTLGSIIILIFTDETTEAQRV